MNTTVKVQAVHSIVVKWTTHREIFEGTWADANAHIDRAEEYGSELRDVDCSSKCQCIDKVTLTFKGQ